MASLFLLLKSELFAQAAQALEAFLTSIQDSAT